MSVVAQAATSSLFFPLNYGSVFQSREHRQKKLVCPWCIGGGAKLWEWAANSQGAIFTLLLRKSDAGGGGDVGRRTIELDIDDDPNALAKAVVAGVAAEGTPFKVPDHSIIELSEMKLEFNPRCGCGQGKE